MLDVKHIKKDFPIFSRFINGKPIVYLDSTASSLKPQQVLDAINEYYTKYSVNIFRGVYKLSEEATEKYEHARKKVAGFIGGQAREIVFVRNATEAINVVASSWGRVNIGQKDEIVTTVMEHHANFVPWQQLALEVGAAVKYVDFDESGYLLWDIKNQKSKIKYTNKRSNIKEIISDRTKLLAITYISNVLGTINPIKEIIKKVKEINPKCLVLVDAAQAVPHMEVDVKDIGCDFLVFSGHKMLGPTGIGVLWGKYEPLEEMPPYQSGGEMIKEVTFKRTTFKDTPYKFEAGTPHVAGAIGLSAAIDYLTSLGMENIRSHEKELLSYALSHLGGLGYLRIYGPKDPEQRGGVISFNLDGVHPHDVAQVLDRDNIYIRSGHHCAMPLHKRLGLSASCRASFYVYNTKEDIDKLIEGLEKVRKVFKKK